MDHCSAFSSHHFQILGTSSEDLEKRKNIDPFTLLTRGRRLEHNYFQAKFIKTLRQVVKMNRTHFLSNLKIKNSLTISLFNRWTIFFFNFCLFSIFRVLFVCLCYIVDSVTLLCVTDNHQLLAHISTSSDWNKQLTNIFFNSIGRLRNKDSWFCKG